MAFLLSAPALVIRLVVALPVPLPLSGGGSFFLDLEANEIRWHEM